MSNIIVTIPVEGEFSYHKYLGMKGRCYLEEALDAEGYTNSHVGAFGCATIDGIPYKTVKRFNSEKVAIAFALKTSLIVELKPEI